MSVHEGKRIGIILTGGNVDRKVYDEVLAGSSNTVTKTLSLWGPLTTHAPEPSSFMGDHLRP